MLKELLRVDGVEDDIPRPEHLQPHEARQTQVLALRNVLLAAGSQAKSEAEQEVRSLASKQALAMGSRRQALQRTSVKDEGKTPCSVKLQGKAGMSSCKQARLNVCGARQARKQPTLLS